MDPIIFYVCMKRNSIFRVLYQSSLNCNYYTILFPRPPPLLLGTCFFFFLGVGFLGKKYPKGMFCINQLTTLFHPSSPPGLLYPCNKLEHVDDVHGSMRPHMVSLKSIHQWISLSPLEKWNILSWLVFRASAGSSRCSACDPAIIFLTSKFSCLFFFQPHP